MQYKGVFKLSCTGVEARRGLGSDVNGHGNCRNVARHDHTLLISSEGSRARFPSTHTHGGWISNHSAPARGIRIIMAASGSDKERSAQRGTFGVGGMNLHPQGTFIIVVTHKPKGDIDESSPSRYSSQLPFLSPVAHTYAQPR